MCLCIYTYAIFGMSLRMWYLLFTPEIGNMVTNQASMFWVHYFHLHPQVHLKTGTQN